MSCHSEHVATKCRKLDYAGIVFNIGSTCASAAYFGLYDHPQLATQYITLILISAGLTLWAVMDPNMDGLRGANRR